MLETERQGVECLPGAEGEAVAHETLVTAARGAAQDFVAAVARVANERMPDMLHVSAYLVGAARFEPALNERHITKAFEHAVMRHGRLSHLRTRRIYRHAQAVVHIAADISLNAPFVFLEVAPHEGVVGAARGFVEKLHAEAGLGLGGLCHHEQARGIFVDAVHQSHGGVVGVVGRTVAQVPGYGVDQSAVVIAATGMHHHACGLVDDHKVAVFINHFEGDILWLNRRVETRAVEQERHDVARLDAVVALYGQSVHVDKAGAGCLLYAVARGVAQMVYQKLVDAQQLLPGISHHAEMLVQLAALLFFNGGNCRRIGDIYDFGGSH